MPRTHTVNRIRSGSLMGFSALCRRLRINPIRLLDDERLPGMALRSPDLMIPLDSFALLLNRAAAEADYPLFGLALSSYQGINTFGALGLIASGHDTVGQGVEAMRRLFRFHAQGVHIDTDTDGEETRIAVEFDLDPRIPPEQLCELSLGLGYKLLHEMSPEGLTSAGLQFTHDALAPVEAYRQHTEAGMAFARSSNALVVPNAMLSRPTASPTAEIRNHLESYLMAQADPSEQTVARTVSKLIDELIPTGEATLATIAPLMNMHERTLQRALSLAGTDFRTLLDHARFDLARDGLALGQSVTDLALNLGYSEISAFSRAFKRWSGVSPQQWRRPLTGIVARRRRASGRGIAQEFRAS